MNRSDFHIIRLHTGTRQMLATALGYSLEYVRALENGNAKITDQVEKRIASRFLLTLDTTGRVRHARRI